MATAEWMKNFNDSVRPYLGFMVVVLLFVLWKCLDNSKRVTKLEVYVEAQKSEAFCGNPYASRLPQSASDPLIGGQPGTNTYAPYGSNINVSCGQVADENFFGGPEPPVFYDIGSVRAARTTRGYKTGVLRDSEGNPVMDAQGNVVMASKAGDYLQNVKDRIAMYGNKGHRYIKEGMTWAPVEQMKEGWEAVGDPNLVKAEHMSDEELLYNQ